jgi:heat shock protein HslJ
MRTILVLMLLLAACSAPLAAPSASQLVEGDDGAGVEGTWLLTTGTNGDGGVPIIDDHPITLTIEGTELSGVAACNRYGGRFTPVGDGVTVREIGMTAMGCEEAIAASEAAYIAALQHVMNVQRDGDELLLTGPQVELRFSRQPEPPTTEMIDTTWVLETLFVGDVASAAVGDPATLRIAGDGSFSGSTGCRTFTGTWVEDGNQIRAPSMSTDGAECPPDLAPQDSQVVGVVGDGFVPSIEGDLLTLTDPGSTGLVYRADE